MIRKAYEQIRPIWEAIAAKVDDGPCVTYIGPDGAGHFVKMVHNGIEYGDMQLIAEAYDILRNALGARGVRAGRHLREWNEGDLEFVPDRDHREDLHRQGSQGKRPLVDLILDEAGQKGTGKWTAEIALELGIVDSDHAGGARFARAFGAKSRTRRGKQATAADRASKYTGDKQELIDAVHDALYASKICSYAQGMNLIRARLRRVQVEHQPRRDESHLERRLHHPRAVPGQDQAGLSARADLPNLLLDPDFKAWVWKRSLDGDRQ